MKGRRFFISRNSLILVVAMLTLWVIFLETIGVVVVVSGIIVSVACVLYARKYMPFGRNYTQGIRLSRMLLYPFRLIWEVYSAGFYMIQLILTDGARADVVDIDLELQDETLKVILAESITLTPGTIFIELEGQRMKLVWFRPKTTQAISDAEMQAMVKGELERLLLRAQR